MACSGRCRRGILHDDPRRRDRQRRDPVDPEGPQDRRVDGAVGDHGVRDHVRGLPPARGSDGRSARAAPHLLRRPRPVHARVADVRAGVERRGTDRLPRGSGGGRRDHLAGRAVDRDDHLQRRSGAEQGTRDLGRARGIRRSRGSPARRDPDQVSRLAVDLLRQRARGCRRVRADSSDRSREPRRPRTSPVRCRWRRERDRRSRPARLRDLEGAGRGLGERPDDRNPARARSPYSRRSSAGSCARALRSSPSRSFASAR